MPIRGYEDISDELFGTLAGAGHGVRIVIGDRSLEHEDITDEVYTYRGVPGMISPSTLALDACLRLVPREGDVIIMAPDLADNSELAQQAGLSFNKALSRLEIPEDETLWIPRLDSDTLDNNGFYSIVRSEGRVIEVDTGDAFPYACATFIVGHSQDGRPLGQMETTPRQVL